MAAEGVKQKKVAAEGVKQKKVAAEEIGQKKGDKDRKKCGCDKDGWEDKSKKKGREKRSCSRVAVGRFLKERIFSLGEVFHCEE